MKKTYATWTLIFGCLSLILLLAVISLAKEGIIDFSIENSAPQQVSPSIKVDTSNNGPALGVISSSDTINSDQEREAAIDSTQHGEVLLSEGTEYILPWVDQYHHNHEKSDILVRLESIEVSKEDRGFFIEGDKHQDNKSYVFATIKLKNLGERDFNTTLNCLQFTAGLNNGYYELRGFDSGNPNEMTQDYYHVTLMPNVENSFCLVFLVPDEVINSNANEQFLYASFDGFNPLTKDMIPIIKR